VPIVLFVIVTLLTPSAIPVVVFRNPSFTPKPALIPTQSPVLDFVIPVIELPLMVRLFWFGVAIPVFPTVLIVFWLITTFCPFTAALTPPT
jgi:hypothetical protein